MSPAGHLTKKFEHWTGLAANVRMRPRRKIRTFDASSWLTGNSRFERQECDIFW